MLCLLLPGIATNPAQIDELVGLAVKRGAEDMFVEPVNARCPDLTPTHNALAASGY